LRSRSFKVEVNPKVLTWAREASGYSIQDAATRTKIAERSLTQWESGSRIPTLEALSKLAVAYRRSVAVLLLSEPPVGGSLPVDFRQLPESKSKLTHKTRLAIRTAHWLTERAGELEAELGLTRPSGQERADISDDPDEIAGAFRSWLGVTIQAQRGFRNVGHAFREWRDVLERIGYFVFLFPMPTSEALGFSVAVNGSRSIVVNSTDDIAPRRIFTLFHECGHLLLAKPGVCLPDVGAVGKSEAVETFCNRFANAFLIPKTEIRQFQDMLRVRDVASAASVLASHYHVSRSVALASMRRFELVSQEQYSELLLKWKPFDKKRKKSGGGKGASRVEKCIRQRGRRVARSVLDGAERELITTTDAMKYLNVKLADLPALRNRIRPSLG